MIPVLESQQWQQAIDAVARPGAEQLLAFYDHRIQAICCDACRMVMPVDDHLVHRGDGVFETLRFAEGKVLNLEAHLLRLYRSAAGLLMEPPCAVDDLREAVLAVAKASKATGGAIRILVGRGAGGFSIDPAECPETSLYISAYSSFFYNDAWYAKGLSACRSTIPVRPSMFAKLKTTNYLPGVLMTLEATQKGVDLVFSFDEDGYLAEAAIANVVLIDKDGVFSIPEFRNALPGTTVKKAAEIIKDRVPVATRRISEAELFSAREILVLGTGHDCVAAVNYEGQPIADGNPGSIAIELRQRIQADLLQHGTPFI